MLRPSEYPLETHYVETQDGYFLTLMRLKTNQKPSLNKTSPEKGRSPVLIVHGFLASGTEWFCNTPDNALPWILNKSGYDCWIACHRGNRLTGPKAHAKYTRKDKQYWDYGPDECGEYDCPALIDYILLKTGHRSLVYIGHSLGCGILFMTLSSKPEYNSKVKLFIAFTPAVFGSSCKIPLITKFIAPLFVLLGKSKFIYCRSMLCATMKESMLPCLPLKRKVSRFGFSLYCCKLFKVLHHGQVNKEQLTQLIRESPGGNSMKSTCHLMQACTSSKFRKYDYGRRGNMLKYNQPIPPDYDLSLVKAKVAIFTSEFDYIITPEDVLRASKELENVIFYKKITEKFFHVDFMFGLDAKRLVYDDVVKLISDVS